MKYDPARHHRRSIRLRGYDYRQAGAYFVTICTQDRELMFGEVVGGQTRLNGPGQMVESIWRELSQHYPGVEVDTFVVMPNHVHGIIILVGAGHVGAGPDNPGQPQGGCPDRDDVVAGCGTLVQTVDHGQISPRGSLWRLATIPRSVVATELL